MRAEIMSACLVLLAAGPAVADPDPCPLLKPAPASPTDRRDGVLRPPPACGEKGRGRARPFRFSGGTTF